MAQRVVRLLMWKVLALGTSVDAALRRIFFFVQSALLDALLAVALIALSQE